MILQETLPDMVDSAPLAPWGASLDQAQAEELAPESFTAWAELLPEALALLDEQGFLLRCNRRLGELLGVGVGTLTGRLFRDFLAATEVERWYALRQQALLHTGIMPEASFTLRHSSGAHLACRVELGLFPTPPTAQVRFLVRLQPHPQGEEILQHMRAVVANTEDAIVAKDLDGTIRAWNEGATRIYGYSAVEMIGQKVFVLTPPDRAQETERILQQLRHGKRIDQLETVRLHKEGRTIHVSLTICPIHDAAGRVIGASAISRDITQRKVLEEQLRQSQKMEAIGHLAGGIAHDFNNLLTIINGYSDILLANGVDEATSRPLLEIRKAGEKAASLTRQLLAFSRKQILQPVVFDLNQTVTDMEKMLQRLIGEDIDLTTIHDPQLGQVKADPGQIEQVILNLAVNARDAMPRGGKLLIQTRNVHLEESYTQLRPEVIPGPYVLLSVKDTGLGMTPEVKAHIFEPFFTTKGQGNGTGLGLSTVYGIIKQSGGHIDVQSTPGRGTTMKIYLPQWQGGLPVHRPEGHTPGSSVGGKETILLAEDDPLVRQLVTVVLRECGYTVLEAGNGVEALKTARNHAGPLHLLLTDIVMPKMSGRELANALHEMHPHLKTLYVSGYTDDALFHHGLQGTGMTLLMKPFTPALLTSKVREVLDGGHSCL
jgi:PAS domain S-box-containing protein